MASLHMLAVTAAQAPDDVFALGKVALAACILEPPHSSNLAAQALKIKWEPIQAVVAQ